MTRHHELTQTSTTEETARGLCVCCMCVCVCARAAAFKRCQRAMDGEGCPADASKLYSRGKSSIRTKSTGSCSLCLV